MDAKTKQYYVGKFIRRCFLQQTMRTMSETVIKNIVQTKRTRNSVYMVMLVNIKYRFRVKKFGFTLNERKKNGLRRNFTFLAQGASENVQAWSKFVLQDFLRDRS
tara:strand:- start:344 stop:658 length:315 start_codon:yes stop_codon:yes gene_type:complete